MKKSKWKEYYAPVMCQAQKSIKDILKLDLKRMSGKAFLSR